jgi:hypothetical protein
VAGDNGIKTFTNGLTLITTGFQLVLVSDTLNSAVRGGTGPDLIVSANAVLSISPTAHNFGAVNVSKHSIPYTFTITNIGVSPSGTIFIGITGTDASQFAYYSGGTCQGATLAPLATCTIDANFSPTSTGAKTASLSVSASPGGSASASITGTGN